VTVSSIASVGPPAHWLCSDETDVTVFGSLMNWPEASFSDHFSEMELPRLGNVHRRRMSLPNP
jgi:hypothetical protein